MEKSILKNEYKYTEHLKLAKGLIIDQATTEYRDKLDVGISSRNFGKNWYILPKGKAIFKTYDSYQKFENIKQIRIINELLCYELAKQVNIPCAEYELATNKNITGLVTYKITDENEILVKGQDFLLFANGEAHNDMISYSRACKYYKELGFKLDRKKVMLDLYKIAVFDALTLQTDRHMNNICFIKNTKTNTIRLAPIIDNELAFLADVCFEHFNSVNDINEISLNNYLYLIGKYLRVKTPANGFMYIKDNIKYLVDLAKLNPKFKVELMQILKNYKVGNAIQILEQKGVEINDKYKEFLLLTKQTTLKLFVDQLSIKDQLIDPYEYKEIIK